MTAVGTVSVAEYGYTYLVKARTAVYGLDHCRDSGGGKTEGMAAAPGRLNGDTGSSRGGPQSAPTDEPTDGVPDVPGYRTGSTEAPS